MTIGFSGLPYHGLPEDTGDTMGDNDETNGAVAEPETELERRTRRRSEADAELASAEEAVKQAAERLEDAKKAAGMTAFSLAMHSDEVAPYTFDTAPLITVGLRQAKYIADAIDRVWDAHSSKDCTVDPDVEVRKAAWFMSTALDMTFRDRLYSDAVDKEYKEHKRRGPAFAAFREASKSRACRIRVVSSPLIHVSYATARKDDEFQPIHRSNESYTGPGGYSPNPEMRNAIEAGDGLKRGTIWNREIIELPRILCEVVDEMAIKLRRALDDATRTCLPLPIHSRTEPMVRIDVQDPGYFILSITAYASVLVPENALKAEWTQGSLGRERMPRRDWSLPLEGDGKVG